MLIKPNIMCRIMFQNVNLCSVKRLDILIKACKRQNRLRCVE